MRGLTDARNDLPLLVRHYVRRFGRELGREVREVATETLERLGGYSWPGNIRELQSVLRKALLKASGTVLLPTLLPDPIGGPADPSTVPPPGEELDPRAFITQRLGADYSDLYTETHRRVDRLLLSLVLEHTHGISNTQLVSLGLHAKPCA
jgi:two-component system nitrogen regulation response regulator GlnG